MNVRSFFLVVFSLVAAAPAARADSGPTTLQWDASSQGSAAGYIVYVGQTSGIYDESYDVRQQTSFVYTKAVPGRPYFFSVAAYNAALEVGPRSEEILFFAGIPTTLPLIADQPHPADEGVHLASARTADALDFKRSCFAGACYEIESLATVAGEASGLTLMVDGRVLFIENGQHVRVIDDDRLIASPALSVNADSTIAALALDPFFEQTRLVYLGVVTRNADGGRQLDVVRYREVANQLGERAVVVAGLPLSDAGDAALAVDAARRLYVALPGVAGDTARAERYAGMVLRFENDGSSVRGDGGDAPVFAPGYVQPTSLAWASPGSEVLLVGRDADGVGAITRLSVSPAEDARASNRPAGAAPGVFVVDEAGAVFRFSPNGEVTLTPWIAPNELGGVVTSVTGDSAGLDTYLAIDAGSNQTNRPSRIVRLRRR
jgi:hypothetical protein